MANENSETKRELATLSGAMTARDSEYVRLVSLI